MKHLLLILFSLLLLPITVFGIEWTVSYDMKKQDGSDEYLTVPISKDLLFGVFEFPNQVGNWNCSTHRRDKEKEGHIYSRMSLRCISKENEIIRLMSTIECNTKDTKKNEMWVSYPKSVNKEYHYSWDTLIVLRCEV